ncbi:MAG: hypoxanthine phosphoribosyltransferase [Nitrospirales bacterium]
MSQIFGKPLVTQEAMRARIKDLGKQISLDYQGKDLLVVGVLKGAYVFFADLVRVIRLPIQIDFLIAKSHKAIGSPAKKVKVWSELTEKINNRHVLLVEDIVDSGVTAQFLVKNLMKKKPSSVAVCALISKPANRKVEVDLRYVGFEVPPTYLVGYGLDFKQKYRNLPYLAKLDPKLVQEDSQS